MLPVSKDTLLRVVRRRSRPPTDPLRVIGIDDWAWRRNHRYASIICNLERRRIVTLLLDREPATAQAWLAGHPTTAIVARDRGGGYGEAAAKALPHAVQVADIASGVVRDEAAVRAAITSPWSNGQTEGQITRLKLVRRQMYGRGNIDLLQARLIGAE